MPKVIDEETPTRGGTWTVDEFSVDKRHERVLIVDASDVNDPNEDDIRFAIGMPWIGTYERGAYLQRIIVSEYAAASKVWKARLFYDSKWDADIDPDEDPVSRPPKYRRYTETIQRAITKSRIGPVTYLDPSDGSTQVGQDIIQNTAREIIPVEAPFTVIVLEIDRLEALNGATLTPAFLKYPNRVNSAVFQGAPIGTVLCSGISDEEEQLNGVAYRRMTYVFKFLPLEDQNAEGANKLAQYTWRESLVNQGTRYVTRTNGGVIEYKIFTDESGNPTTGNLGFGGEKKDDLPPLEILVDIYGEVDFNALNF